MPGDRPDRIAKAREAGAGVVCVDLEDSVAADRKGEARRIAVELARQGDVGLAVRINRLASRNGVADLHALADTPPATVLLPMCEHERELDIARAVLGEAVSLVPLIETVGGLRRAAKIARGAGASAIMFGGGDLSAELGVALEWEPLLTARSLLVMAAAEARIAAIDVPFTRLDDQAGLAEECGKARNLGFSAKAAIHPKQLETIRQTFQPSVGEREEARAALRAFREGGGAAIRWNGRLIEAPLIPRLERIAGEAHA